MAITAKTKIGDSQEWTEATVSRDIGNDVRSLVKEFGEEQVGKAAQQHLRVQLQAYMRRLLEAGKTADEIEALCATWTPGMTVAAAPKDPKAAFNAAWAAMSEEDRAKVLAEHGISA